MAILTDPVDRFRYMVARSAHFTDWVGVDPELSAPDQLTAAHAHTYPLYYPDITAAILPFALVETASKEKRRTASGGGAYRTDDAVAITFYGPVTGDDPTDLELIEQLHTFGKLIEHIVNDMCALAGGGNNYIDFHHLEEASKPALCPPEESVPHMACVWIFESQRFGCEEV